MFPAKQCGAMDRVGRAGAWVPRVKLLNLRAPAVKWDHNSYSVWGSVRGSYQFGDPVLKLYELMDWRSSSFWGTLSSSLNPTCTHLSSHAPLLGAPSSPARLLPGSSLRPCLLSPTDSSPYPCLCWLWNCRSQENKIQPLHLWIEQRLQNICNFTSALWATWRSWHVRTCQVRPSVGSRFVSKPMSHWFGVCGQSSKVI